MTFAETTTDLADERLGAGIGDRLALEILYEALLERSAHPEELDHYLLTLQDGWPAGPIVASIAASAEAEAARARNLETATPPWERPPVLARPDFSEVNARPFFALLYDCLLGRPAGTDELEQYAGDVSRGTPLVHLIASIAESAEAYAFRARLPEPAPVEVEPAQAEVAETPASVEAAVEPAPFAEPAPDLVVVRSHEAFTIRTDDVLNTIAQVYRAAGREPPAFDDAMSRFAQFRQGADLSAVVADVTPAPVEPLLPEPAPTVLTEPREHVEYVIRILYRDLLKRPASPDEVAVWYGLFEQSGLLSNVVIAIAESGEAAAVRSGPPSDVPAGVMVQLAYEIILGRGASAFEVDQFRTRMERSGLSIDAINTSFFQDAVARRLAVAKPRNENDPDQAYLFGSEGVVDASVWKTRPRVKPTARKAPENLFRMKRTKDPVVSIITSLYRGGDYIERFLQNITSQTIFKDHCELIIIDANSPENEGEVIARYEKQFPNIVYRRFESRIGIYEAWNMGVALATGRYLTNANLDDLRREDSLELQASVLDSLPFVDVTYQDVLYSFEPNISFEEIESHGLRAKLPVISHYNLMEFNSPHNGPMWRKTLHAEIGTFNETYKSAADFDFWLRCLIKGKTFYKVNEPHVAYYVNPQGLSTRADTRGAIEANIISSTLYRQLISTLLTMSDADFLDRVGDVPPEAAQSPRRYDILQSALLAHGAGRKGASA